VAHVHWQKGQCALLRKLASVPGWIDLARAVLLRVCPSLHSLKTLLHTRCVCCILHT
jgi:hypothetical protein